MNSTQVMGVVRDIIKAIGVVFVAYGYLDGGTVEMIAGAAATLFASAWSWYTNMTATMIKTVAASDEVKKVVVTTMAVADSVGNPKVRTS